MKAIGQLSREILSKDINVLYFESIDSTNTYAKENFESLQYPNLILTDHQVKGRGRNQHTWTATQPGNSLYSTWSFKHTSPPSPVLSMRVGLCLYHALKQTLHLDVSLKPANDIYLDAKKLVGILIEGIHYKNDFYTFIGVGINVRSTPLSTATYIEQHTTLTTESWENFLFFFSQNLATSMHMNQSTLTNEEQNQLLTAVKKYSLYKDLIQISPQGDLIFSDKTVPWSEL